MSKSHRPGHPKLLLILLAVVGTASVLTIAQQNSLPDIIEGWDFTGMTDEEKAFSFQVLHPDEHAKALDEKRSPEELATRDFQRWAITHPIEFADQHPRTQAEQIAIEEALKPVLDPVAYEEQYVLHMTAEQRAARDAAISAITGPAQMSPSQADSTSYHLIDKPRETPRLILKSIVGTNQPQR